MRMDERLLVESTSVVVVVVVELTIAIVHRLD